MLHIYQYAITFMSIRGWKLLVPPPLQAGSIINLYHKNNGYFLDFKEITVLFRFAPKKAQNLIIGNRVWMI